MRRGGTSGPPAKIKVLHAFVVWEFLSFLSVQEHSKLVLGFGLGVFLAQLLLPRFKQLFAFR
jgi:hypothetical protein